MITDADFFVQSEARSFGPRAVQVVVTCGTFVICGITLEKPVSRKGEKVARQCMIVPKPRFLCYRTISRVNKVRSDIFLRVEIPPNCKMSSCSFLQESEAKVKVSENKEFDVCDGGGIEVGGVGGDDDDDDVEEKLCQ